MLELTIKLTIDLTIDFTVDDQMSSSAPTSRPRPRPPRERLSNLRDSPLPQPKQYPKKKARKCPGCSTPDIQEIDGQTVCVSCGTVISDSVIVNEISYGEATSGAAIVQGTTVHEGQRFAKSSGTAFRRGGRSSEDHAETALREGKDELTRLADALKIPNVVDTAYRYYTMARIHHFHRPRRENAAICLYIACRQQNGNTTMLIDFAELISCNVFDLGATYKQFLKAISLEDEIESIPLIEIEPLILKYAKRLEFGNYTKLVANDAASILSRMDRDWIVTGRQPAALCGACLILAARMNNFRRSVREVVYVVKAGEVSIHKRLEEFRRTKAGRMTVKQFRDYGKRLKDTAEPPILYESRRKEERKRKRDASSLEISSTPDPATLLPTPTPSHPPRMDAEGFVIPDLPIDPSLTLSALSHADSTDSTSQQPPKKRRRKDKPVPMTLTPDDLLPSEAALEQEISTIVAARSQESAFEAARARATMIAHAELEREAAARARRRPTSWRNAVAESETVAADEFDDDPEVANCLLTPREVDAKERIWVSYNADWLRARQERELDAALEAARGLSGARRGGGRAPSAAARRPDAAAQAPSPAATPAEAMLRLIERRAGRASRAVFSRHLNYDKLKRIYAPSAATSEGAPSVSGASARSASPGTPESGDGGGGGGDGEDDDGEVVEVEADESERAAQRDAGTSSKNNPIEISDDESTDVSSEDEDDEPDAGPTGARQHFGDAYDEEMAEEEEEEDVDYDELGLREM